MAGLEGRGRVGNSRIRPVRFLFGLCGFALCVVASKFVDHAATHIIQDIRKTAVAAQIEQCFRPDEQRDFHVQVYKNAVTVEVGRPLKEGEGLACRIVYAPKGRHSGVSTFWFDGDSLNPRKVIGKTCADKTLADYVMYGDPVSVLAVCAQGAGVSFQPDSSWLERMMLEVQRRINHLVP